MGEVGGGMLTFSVCGVCRSTLRSCDVALLSRCASGVGVGWGIFTFM